MKQLWIVRHAKSDWGNPGLADFDRPLNNRGLRDAPAMGEWLDRQGVEPELLLCSPARRAKHTAEQIAKAISYPLGKIRFEQRIYEADPETLLALIGLTESNIGSLMLVGHNPGLTLLVNILGGGPLDNLPTCAVAALQFDCDDWLLQGRSPRAAAIWRPKEVLA